MLLRSSSTPDVRACFSQSAPAVDSTRRIASKPMISSAAPSTNRIRRISSESNMRRMAIPERQNPPPSCYGTTLPYVSGGGVGGGAAGGKGYGDRGRGKESMDEYYQKMIRNYPGDSLLLANYIKFLIEVRGDLEKAEEYCERAILEKPDDGEVLSIYADLMWTSHGDLARAVSYSTRAAQASPENCHVLASNARHLWAAAKLEEEVSTSN